MYALVYWFNTCGQTVLLFELLQYTLCTVDVFNNEAKRDIEVVYNWVSLFAIIRYCTTI